MKKSLLVACAMLAPVCANSSEKPHWGYAGDEGPAHWATLSGEYSSCSGKNQSPVNLTDFVESDLPPIKFDYRAGGTEILNNGHTVQINYEPGSSITVDGVKFTLSQFHFHAPSENNINGQSYPLEAHLVHADQSGNLAVIAIMFDNGPESTGLANAWAKMPKHAGDKYQFDAKVSASDILPVNLDYYRFNGSLTTPPCTEGVRWFVMKDPVTASIEQIDSFKSSLHGPNNRPLQALNARTVLQ